MPAVDVTHLYTHLQTLSTDYQRLIFHELCPAAARVLLSDPTVMGTDSCLEQGQRHLFPCAFNPGYIVQEAGKGHSQEPRQYQE